MVILEKFCHMCALQVADPGGERENLSLISPVIFLQTFQLGQSFPLHGDSVTKRQREVRTVL